MASAVKGGPRKELGKEGEGATARLRTKIYEHTMDIGRLEMIRSVGRS